ncbi:hydroxyacylglutathione hydrolase [Solimicrobium silvestre]|uniref:Hydroxyacylglutathione hydrolase n=1 Tax=Solimicrobium silvestre TaxID=2099400 RepID=A0A2S9GTU1_9BURK|nr:hydroxyacylglutathione hydrolase [Solimicrobium silvestre]PRC91086.1 Hydroxyacylglutathione hydrolase [Solimicrobium silvestre]
MTNIHIQQIPAFDDNYFWLIHNDQNAIIVDPGDAAPVLAYLNQHQLTLSAILITHHHADHIGGVDELLSHAAVPVYGPLADQQSGRISTITQGCQQGETLFLKELNLHFDVLEVPGHTSTHIAYYCAALSSLFCGDTLFAGGCGRLFEGTPAQMVASLRKISALPANTNVYCAHEYTLSNLRFALAVEPNNAALQNRFKLANVARENGLSTVPSQLNLELQTNPFLRSSSPEIIHTLQNKQKLSDVTDEVTVFAAVREWKNTF